MKIAVIMATRGRPERAAGVIECARNLMSGRQHVEFIVALDGDDTRSVEFFANYNEELTAFASPRPPGVGDCWNRVAKHWKADIYVPISDDAWMAEPFWDLKLIDVLDRHPLCKALGIVSFWDIANPTVAVMFGITPKWLKQVGWLLDPRFPFWWADTALVETAIFATGQGIPQTDNLRFVMKPGAFNPRLRDMDLWWDLFAATRHERVDAARRICQQGGLPFPEDKICELVRQCEERDAKGRAQAPDVLASIEKPAPPSREYEQAKANAQAIIESYSAIPARIPLAGISEGPHP